MKKIAFILVLFVATLGCDKNVVVVPEFEPIDSERVVLLEEMTGVSCPNCPKGTAEIDAIKALYGDQVIPVGIHGIFLSWPTKESHFDFRNEFSRLLETNLAPGTSKPAALINRSLPSGASSKVVQSPDLWSGYVESQLAIDPKVSIELELVYEATTRTLNINAGIVANENLTNPTKISVMILENNLVDAQEDLNEIIEDFEHNHVLRTMLTPFDGESLTNQFSAAEIINKTYQFVIPIEEGMWKENDIEVVVFVHEEGGSEEVLQAAMRKLFQ